MPLTGAFWNLSPGQSARDEFPQGDVKGAQILKWAIDHLTVILSNAQAYILLQVGGFDPKGSCRLASVAALGGATVYNNTGGTSSRGQITGCPLNLDGVALVAADRVLVKDDAAGLGGDAHGIYVVTTLGTGADGVWDRAGDFDADAEVSANAYVWVSEGTQADSGWVLTTNDPITIGGAGGTVLAWSQYTGLGLIVAGAGMTKTGNTLDVIATDGSLTINANDMGVNAGDGLTIGADLAVQATDTTLTVGAGGVQVAPAISGQLRSVGYPVVGAEVVNVRAVEIEIRDWDGNAVNEAQSFYVRVSDNQYDDSGAANATLTLTGGGDGTVNQGTATARVHVTTAAGNGRIDLDVTDASAETVYLGIEPAAGSPWLQLPAKQALTFA